MGHRNIQRLLQAALVKGEQFDLGSSDVLQILPEVDDQGYIKIGNGTYSMDVKWYGSSTGNTVLFDVGNDIITLDDVDLALGDLDLLVFGDGRDVIMQYDGTDLDFIAAGPCDVVADGPVRLQGFNATSPRFELKWIAGSQGLPQLNAVTDPPAGDTYNTNAVIALLNADRHFEILGTNASSDDVTLWVEGGIKVETDGADGDQVVLLPNLNTGQSPWETVTWGTDRETIWEAHIKTGSAVTKTQIHAGLKLTDGVGVSLANLKTTDANSAFFYFDADTNAHWYCHTSIANTDVETVTTVDVTADTDFHLKLTIQSDRTCEFWINGTKVYTSTALASTDLKPYIGITAREAAAKHMYIFGQSISREFAAS